MGRRAATIFQKPVEESSGGVEVVNPVWGTNWCLPRHTSTKTLGKQTALVYLSTLPHSHSLGRVIAKKGGGGWKERGSAWGGGGRSVGHVLAQDRSRSAASIWRGETPERAATAHGHGASSLLTRAAQSPHVVGLTPRTMAYVPSVLHKLHYSHGRCRKPSARDYLGSACGRAAGRTAGHCGLDPQQPHSPQKEFPKGGRQAKRE